MRSEKLLEVYNLSKTATSIHCGENALIQSANDAMLKIWGKDRSVVGKPLLEVLPELKGQPYPEMFRKAWTDGQTFTGEGSPASLELNGISQTFYFDFEYLPVRDAGGEIIAVMNSAIDVTDRVLRERAIKLANESHEMLKKTEEKYVHLKKDKKTLSELNSELEKLVEERLQGLLESEERFRLMAENTELLISVGDEDNNRIYFNTQWERVTGRKIVDLLEKGWVDLIHPDEKEAFIKSYHHAYSKRELFTSEFRLPDSTGEYRWFLCQCPPRFRPDGSFAGYIASCIDITLRKNEEIRKNEFIGVVSHELKTPLTALNGFVQIMRVKLEQMDHNYIRSALDKVQNQINKMSIMINSFLDISRLESGNMEFKIEPLPLEEVLKEVLEELLIAYPTHRISAELSTQGMVYGDRGKISAVLSNLVSNAVKYSPYGSNINIECGETTSEMVISVCDEGPGISEEEQKKIFERFYRSKSSPTISGFGIGLYLCSEIIKMHGGRIWVESRTGTGSQFRFTLPKAENNIQKL